MLYNKSDYIGLYSLALRLNEHNLTRASKHHQKLDAIREAQTIHLNLGRLTFKTDFIKEIGKDIDAVIVPSALKKSWGDKRDHKLNIIYSDVRESGLYEALKREPRYLFIDEPKLVERDISLLQIQLVCANLDFNGVIVCMGG